MLTGYHAEIVRIKEVRQPVQRLPVVRCEASTFLGRRSEFEKVFILTDAARVLWRPRALPAQQTGKRLLAPNGRRVHHLDLMDPLIPEIVEILEAILGSEP
jgi:hypothetical protein